MKINEIALNENLLTKGAQFVGKALPRIERLPGETMIDAIKRAKSELGGVKSADNLVSPAELSALRRDPVPSSSGPAVWRNPSTGEISSVPPAGGSRVPPRPTAPGVTVDQLRTPANGTASMNINSAKRAAQASAERRAAAPKPAETPADDLAKQIKPGADAPKTTGGRREPGMDAKASDDGIKFTKAEILDMMKRQANQTPSINIGTDAAKKSSFPWKTTAAAAAFLGPTAYNQFSPPTAPKLSNTPLSLTGDALVSAGTNYMKNQNIPGVTSVTPVSNNEQPVTPVTQDAVDTAKKTDPANQEVTQEIEKWNRDHPDNPIKESHTNELNRIVFLSRP